MIIDPGARRGGRRPIVVGDDRALPRVVTLLHRERTLATTPLAMVPVGPPAAVSLASALGIPTDAVRAARTVIDGLDHRLDLLVDDSDGVVIGELSVPYGAAGTHPVDAAGPPGLARAGETARRAGPAGPAASGADAGPGTGTGAAQAPELAPDRAARVVQHPAFEQVQRPVVAQQILDRGGEQRRVGAQRRQLLGVLEQRPPTVARRVNARLVARVEQQHAGGDHLLLDQPVLRVMGRDHRADQVVAGRRAAINSLR